LLKISEHVNVCLVPLKGKARPLGKAAYPPTFLSVPRGTTEEVVPLGTDRKGVPLVSYGGKPLFPQGKDRTGK